MPILTPNAEQMISRLTESLTCKETVFSLELNDMHQDDIDSIANLLIEGRINTNQVTLVLNAKGIDLNRVNLTPLLNTQLTGNKKVNLTLIFVSASLNIDEIEILVRLIENVCAPNRLTINLSQCTLNTDCERRLVTAIQGERTPDGLTLKLPAQSDSSNYKEMFLTAIANGVVAENLSLSFSFSNFSNDEFGALKTMLSSKTLPAGLCLDLTHSGSTVERRNELNEIINKHAANGTLPCRLSLLGLTDVQSTLDSLYNPYYEQIREETEDVLLNQAHIPKDVAALICGVGCPSYYSVKRESGDNKKPPIQGIRFLRQL